MDSLTQIVLGASVGELVLGRKIGNKAMLYGAIAGTIPDLDVLASYFTDTVSALAIHRGFTHSIVFSILMAPIFSWIVTRYEAYKNFKQWSWLFFWVLITHPILDAHTTWGTQLLWPLDLRVAFKTIFVIDPLYTFPFLVLLILCMQQRKTSKKRRLFNGLGLGLSSVYLMLSFVFKSIAFAEFEDALHDQNISYHKIDTRPSPLNTILWNANIERDKDFLLADYSFFDTQPMSFKSYPKNHFLLEDMAEDKKLKQMIKITKGWYTISKKDENLYFNDLRFGLLNMNLESQDFVFQYKIDTDNRGGLIFTEVEKNRKDAKKLLLDIWYRMLGN